MKNLLLFLMLTWSFINVNDPHFREWFEKAKVGDSYGYEAGDGCNQCSGTVVKVSETEVSDNAGCFPFSPTIKVK